MPNCYCSECQGERENIEAAKTYEEKRKKLPPCMDSDKSCDTCKLDCPLR